MLTRNGRAAAVIMSPEDLEVLEDTLELLSDTKALKEINRARQQVAHEAPEARWRTGLLAEPTAWAPVPTRPPALG